MLIEIDISCLSDDERYHLTEGLEALKNPSQSCKEALVELRRISREEFSKFCKKYPGNWV